MPELAKIIQCNDMADDVMAVRWAEGEPGVIPWGSQLIVQQGQVAVFYRDGQTMEAFQQGRYMLTTQNVAFLTKFITGLAYGGGKTPFHATVYYVSTKPFTDLRWGTPSHIYIEDPILQRIPVRSNGRFTAEISNPAVFCARLVGTKANYRTSDIETYLRETYIIPTLTSVLARLKKTITELPGYTRDIAMGSKAMMAEDLQPYGLELKELSVLTISTTEEIQAKLDKLSNIQVEALEIKQKREAAGATNAAELGQLELMRGIGAGQAKGATGAAGAGGSMGEAGMSMMMPMMMMQMMQQMKAQTAPAPAATPVAAAPAQPANDPIARLQKLKGLFEAGLITEEDFKAQKAEILKQL